VTESLTLPEEKLVVRMDFADDKSSRSFS